MSTGIAAGSGRPLRRAGGTGRFWVARADSTGGAQGLADIVTPAGDYLGTLRFEDLRVPMAFGPDGLMAYLETDDLGVRTVLVVKLISLQAPE